MKNNILVNNIPIRSIIKNSFNNKVYINSLIKDIFLEYNNIRINDNNLNTLFYLLITQLPTFLLIDDFTAGLISKMGNNYSICDSINCNKILRSNFILPNYKHSPIPFSFSYKYKKKEYNILSKVYYYEIFISNNQFYFEKNIISIGFGNCNTIQNNKCVGWTNNTIGFHSDDGCIYYNGKKICKFKKFHQKDKVGVGLYYKKKNIFNFFVTVNGKIFKILEEIKLHGYISPLVGFNSTISIYVNFGSLSYQIDVKKLYNNDNDYNTIISTKNNFLDKYDYTDFYTKFKINILPIHENIDFLNYI